MVSTMGGIVSEVGDIFGGMLTSVGDAFDFVMSADGVYVRFVLLFGFAFTVTKFARKLLGI